MTKRLEQLWETLSILIIGYQACAKCGRFKFHRVCEHCNVRVEV